MINILDEKLDNTDNPESTRTFLNKATGRQDNDFSDVFYAYYGTDRQATNFKLGDLNYLKNLYCKEIYPKENKDQALLYLFNALRQSIQFLKTLKIFFHDRKDINAYCLKVLEDKRCEKGFLPSKVKNKYFEVRLNEMLHTSIYKKDPDHLIADLKLEANKRSEAGDGLIDVNIAHFEALLDELRQDQSIAQAENRVQNFQKVIEIERVLLSDNYCYKPEDIINISFDKANLSIKEDGRLIEGSLYREDDCMYFETEDPLLRIAFTKTPTREELIEKFKEAEKRIKHISLEGIVQEKPAILDEAGNLYLPILLSVPERYARMDYTGIVNYRDTIIYLKETPVNAVEYQYGYVMAASKTSPLATDLTTSVSYLSYEEKPKLYKEAISRDLLEELERVKYSKKEYKIIVENRYFDGINVNIDLPNFGTLEGQFRYSSESGWVFELSKPYSVYFKFLRTDIPSRSELIFQVSSLYEKIKTAKANLSQYYSFGDSTVPFKVEEGRKNGDLWTEHSLTEYYVHFIPKNKDSIPPNLPYKIRLYIDLKTKAVHCYMESLDSYYNLPESVDADFQEIPSLKQISDAYMDGVKKFQEDPRSY